MLCQLSLPVGEFVLDIYMFILLSLFQWRRDDFGPVDAARR